MFSSSYVNTYILYHLFYILQDKTVPCGTVIVFSDIQPQGLSAFQMTAACYANGVNAWLGGGALGALLGGNLLLLCGRPAANLIMHAKGAALARQSAERRAERAAARAAEAEEDEEEAEDEYEEEEPEDEPAGPAFHIGVPDWLNGIRHWGHKVTEEMEAEEPEAAPQPEPPACVSCFLQS